MVFVSSYRYYTGPYRGVLDFHMIDLTSEALEMFIFIQIPIKKPYES